MEIRLIDFSRTKGHFHPFIDNILNQIITVFLDMIYKTELYFFLSIHENFQNSP